MQFQEKK